MSDAEAKRTCKKCGVIEGADDADGMAPKVRILSNGYCYRCDKVLFGPHEYPYPFWYPWYWQITYPAKDTGSGDIIKTPDEYQWVVSCERKTPAEAGWLFE